MSAGAAEFRFAALEDLPPLPPTPARPPSAGGPAVAEPAAPDVDVEALCAEARAEGHAAGAAEARELLAGPAATLRAAAAEIGELRDTIAGSAERAAVELALAVAAQALQGALDVEPERVVDVVRGTLRRLLERERLILLVSPEDLDVVRDHADGLIAELGGIEHCEVQADRRVPRGGAIVRTAEGEVDGTLETKLERAREVVRDALAR